MSARAEKQPRGLSVEDATRAQLFITVALERKICEVLLETYDRAVRGVARSVDEGSVETRDRLIRSFAPDGPGMDVIASSMVIGSKKICKELLEADTELRSVLGALTQTRLDYLDTLDNVTFMPSPTSTATASVLHVGYNRGMYIPGAPNPSTQQAPVNLSAFADDSASNVFVRKKKNVYKVRSREGRGGRGGVRGGRGGAVSTAPTHSDAAPDDSQAHTEPTAAAVSAAPKRRRGVSRPPSSSSSSRRSGSRSDTADAVLVSVRDDFDE